MMPLGHGNDAVWWPPCIGLSVGAGSAEEIRGISQTEHNFTPKEGGR
jgi:hypothetical protein